MCANKTDACFSSNPASSAHADAAREILRLLCEEAMTRFPAFPEAFGRLRPTERSGMNLPLGTDGLHLFFDPDTLCRAFLSDPERLGRCLLHVHVHCLCLHTIQTRPIHPELWDLACDLSAGLLAELLVSAKKPALRRALEAELRAFGAASRSGSPSGAADRALSDCRTGADDSALSGCRTDEDSSACSDCRTGADGSARSDCLTGADDSARSDCLTGADGSARPDHWQDAADTLQQSGWLDAVRLVPFLAASSGLRALAASCACDTHAFWIRPGKEESRQRVSGDPLHSASDSPQSASETPPCADPLRLAEAVQKCWSSPGRKLPGQSKGGKRGKASGSVSEEAELKRTDQTDYRRFLRQFAVLREEPQIDPDSFDYIPYYYGLTQLSDAGRRFPLLEPLEYSEVCRLDELAIAIDTSGSCSGRIVRRFLEETWSILSQRENFFSRMRLHLIQCDCVIQEHRIFTSVQEWEAALPGLRILGHGNTDFCPVFDLLEKLIARKEIRRLRGLLYFTDGDGIYPSSAPSFRTAFVFLNDRTQKRPVPDWAIRLNLQLPDCF